MKRADVAGFASRKAAAAKAGKLRGLGYATYIEACGIAPEPGRSLTRRRRRPVESRGRVNPTARSKS